MKFQTAITTIKDGQELVRGYKLTDLAEQKSFSDAIWLLLRGEFPTPAEAKMFGAILTITLDHGSGTASAQATRIAASVKTSIQAAVAAGLLAMGERHIGALDSAAKFFVENSETKDLSALLADLKSKKIRVPGFGHSVLTIDHRSQTLLSMAKETGFYKTYSQFAEEVEKELNAQASKPLPLNVDGTVAGILLDMGFTPGALTGIFIIGRIPGLVAQATEEMQADLGLRRLPEEEIEYTGPAPREIGV